MRKGKLKEALIYRKSIEADMNAVDGKLKVMEAQAGKTSVLFQGTLPL